MAAVVFSVLLYVPADEGALQAAGVASSQRWERTTLPIAPLIRAAGRLLVVVAWLLLLPVALKNSDGLQSGGM